LFFSSSKFCFLFPGIPLNKSLYTVSYMLLSSAASGLTFMALYILVSSKFCDNRKLSGRDISFGFGVTFYTLYHQSLRTVIAIFCITKPI